MMQKITSRLEPLLARVRPITGKVVAAVRPAFAKLVSLLPTDRLRALWARLLPPSSPLRQRLQAGVGALTNGDWPVGVRLSLVAGVVIMLIMGGLSVVVGRSSGSALQERVNQGLASSTDAIVGTLEVYADGLLDNVVRLYGGFLGSLPQNTVAAFPEERQPAGERDAPTLRMDDLVLNNNLEVVDNFTTNTEGVATIFVLDGSDMVRITTSLMDENGVRVLGTTLEPSHPAYDKLINGEPHTSLESLYGANYVTHYEPIFSNSGSSDDMGGVIGAVLVGLSYDTAVEALREKLRSLKVGDAGELVAINLNGDVPTFAVHSSLEEQPVRGDGAPEAAAAYAELLDKPDGAYELRLPAGEAGKVSTQAVVLRTFEPWKWRILAQAPRSAIEAEASALSNRLLLFSLIGAVVIVLALSWLAGWLVGRPLKRTVQFANGVASGDLSSSADQSAKGEIGSLNRALSRMVSKLLERQEEERRAAAEIQKHAEEAKRIATEAKRIADALDAASSAVMIVDAGHEIRYANLAMQSLMRAGAEDFRQVIAGFDAGTLIDSSFDRFDRLDGVRGKAHQLEKVFGQRTYRINVSPLTDASGKYQGSLIDWTERTAELAVQAEVAQLIAAASQGDLEGRLSLDDKKGFIRNLGESLNSLLDAMNASIEEVRQVLSAVAEGDLSVRSAADLRGTFGELRDYANSSADKLADVLGEIRNAAEAIGTASSEIAAGNADLSNRTEQQAAKLEQTASSMEEMTATVKQNAEAARQAATLADGASKVAREGGAVVDEVTQTMRAIDESARKVAGILASINSIAFQTNILALNAAVEAARAGEAGRGFAVVATEVRSLAQRTTDAAKQIRVLNDESGRRIRTGTELANQAGKTMQGIVGSVKQVSDLIAEISAASVEQSQGITHVSEAVSQMDEATQQNAALVEEASAAAQSMRDQAEDLRGMVARFRLPDDEAATES